MFRWIIQYQGISIIYRYTTSPYQKWGEILCISKCINYFKVCLRIISRHLEFPTTSEKHGAYFKKSIDAWKKYLEWRRISTPNQQYSNKMLNKWEFYLYFEKECVIKKSILNSIHIWRSVWNWRNAFIVLKVFSVLFFPIEAL